MLIAEEIRSSTLCLIASYKCSGEAPCVAWQLRECIPLALCCTCLTGVSYDGYFKGTIT